MWFCLLACLKPSVTWGQKEQTNQNAKAFYKSLNMVHICYLGICSLLVKLISVTCLVSVTSLPAK